MLKSGVRNLGCSMFVGLFLASPTIASACYVLQRNNCFLDEALHVLTWHFHCCCRSSSSVKGSNLHYQRQVTSICYLKQKNCTVLVVQTGEGCAACFSFGQNSCISHLAIPIGTFKSRLPCVSCLIMLEETLATVFQLQWVCNVPLSLWSLTFS